MSKKILITGANGFLGSAIVKLALKKRFNVKVLVRRNSDLSNLKKLKSKIEIFYGDIRDIDSLIDPVRQSDIIFHVAADYRIWAEKFSELYESNVFGTENITKVICEFKKKLIYTSSVATLGLIEGQISDEETPVCFDDMIGHYKKSKYLAEQVVLKYIKKRGLNGIVVNPSTPIGPGDIKPTPTGKIVLDMLSKNMPAYVDTGLNFVHVDDVAEGHFLAEKHGKAGEKYILGGENLSLKDFLDDISFFGKVPQVKVKLNPSYLYFFAFVNEIFSKYFFDSQPRLTIDGLRMSEKKMFFSSDKAKKELRYRPRNLKNAIKDAVNWTKLNFLNSIKKK